MNEFDQAYDDLASWRQLEPWEQGYARLAELPDAAVDSWLSADSEGGSPYVHIGASDAPPQGWLTSEPLPLGWRGQAARLRDLPYAPGGWMSLGKPEGYWTWRAAIGRELRVLGGITNFEAKPHREWAWGMCQSPARWGSVVRYENGKTQWVPLSCSERWCPDCTDRDAARLGNEYADWMLAVAKKHRTRLWWVVGTLPAEVEAMPDKKTGRDLVKRLTAEIRTAMGFKTRDNLASYAAVHVVGDKSPLRRRWHVHIGIVPVVVRRKRKQAPELLKFTGDSLNVEQLRAGWSAAIRDVLGLVDAPDVIPPHVAWSTARRSPPRGVRGAAYARHRITYDTRGFGQDMAEGVFAYGQDGLVAVGRRDRRGQPVDVAVVSLGQYARAWMDVRRGRSVRPHGLMARRSADAVCQVLGVWPHDVAEPPILDELDGIARLDRWQRGQTVEEQLVVFVKNVPMPVDGVGRLGGGVEWLERPPEKPDVEQPRAAPPPPEPSRPPDQPWLPGVVDPSANGWIQ